MLLSDSERVNGEKNTLLSDSERAKREKTCFWVAQKEQMEKKHASERLRKSKWRKNTLL